MIYSHTVYYYNIQYSAQGRVFFVGAELPSRLLLLYKNKEGDIRTQCKNKEIFNMY